MQQQVEINFVTAVFWLVNFTSISSHIWPKYAEIQAYVADYLLRSCQTVLVRSASFLAPTLQPSQVRVSNEAFCRGFLRSLHLFGRC